MRNISKFIGLAFFSLALSTSLANADEIKSISGGIGEEGREIIKNERNNYSLEIIFTGNEGMYLSEIAVKIADKKGNIVFETTTDGPILLVNLPKGDYVVNADAEDQHLKQDLKLAGGKNQTSYLRFNIKKQ